jgi:hypothetical protein
MAPWEEGEALHDILAEIIHLKREENALCRQRSEHPSFTVRPPWAMHEPLGHLIQ